MSNLKAWHGRDPDCAECLEAAKLGPMSAVPTFLLFGVMGCILVSCVVGCSLGMYSLRTGGVHGALLIMGVVAAFLLPVFQRQIQGEHVYAYVDSARVFHVHYNLPEFDETAVRSQYVEPFAYLRLGWGIGVDKSELCNVKDGWTLRKQDEATFVLQDSLGVCVPGVALRSILAISATATDWNEIIERGLRHEDLLLLFKRVEERRNELELAREQGNDLGERLAIEASAIILLMEDSRGSMGRSKHAQLVRERFTAELERGTLISQREKWRRLARHKLADEQGVNDQDQAEEVAQ